MAQLDRLLSHLVARGALSLRMEPGQQPQIELPGGSVQPLLPQPLPPTMLEVLAREVLPADKASAFQSSGEARFPYQAGGQDFQLLVQRGATGIRIEAEPSGMGGAGLGPAGLPVTVGSPVPPTGTAPASSPAVLRPGASVGAAVSAARGGHPLAERLFAALLERKGSDIHCSSHEAPMARVNGDLDDLGDFPVLTPEQLMEMMEALAPPAMWKRFLECHDADFAYPFEAGGCRLRVNYFMDRMGPGFVCRVIPNELPDPDKLGLPDPIRRLADLSKGLVLVTGPTGSGKSTTLAAIIDLANRKRNDHILTLEDPIEFVHPRKRCLVNQREIGSHTDSFKAGLRAALREDPDIILVGEMRDLETIALALETAITGHLVFGTLHTNSAVSTIDRIVDQFPADRQQQVRVMLADALKASISQILLKKSTGGRVAALESLFITPAISNLIREAKNYQIPSAMQTGRAYGQKLMNDALIELVQSRTVEPMEAYMKCPDKESYMAALKRAGITWDPRGEEKPMPL